MNGKIFKITLAAALTFTMLLSCMAFSSVTVSAEEQSTEFAEIDIDFDTYDMAENVYGLNGSVATIEGRQALKMNVGTSRISTGIAADDTEKYEVKFSFYPKTTDEQYVFLFDGAEKYMEGTAGNESLYRLAAVNGAASGRGQMYGWMSGKNAWAFGNGDNRLSFRVAAQWYDVTAVFDHMANTVTVSITDPNGAEMQVNNVATTPYTIDLPDEAYLKELRFMCADNSNYSTGSPECYMDDISVNRYNDSGEDGGEDDDGEIPEETPDIVVPDVDEIPSFENISIDFEDAEEGDINPDNIYGTVETVDRSKVLKLEEGKASIFATGIQADDTGKYELKFSVRPDTKADEYLFSFDGNVPYSSNLQWYRLAFFTTPNNGQIHGWINGKNEWASTYNDNRFQTSYQTECWYDVTAVFDHTAMTVDVTIKGGTLDSEGAKYTIDMPEGAYFKQFKLQVADKTNNTADATCYVDNISVRRLIGDAPTINQDGVIMTDVWGNTVENNLTEVTPGIDKITLDFGTELITRTVKDQITFKDDDGNSVAFAQSLDQLSGKYTMDITGILKPETTYTITVPDTVESAWNNTLEAEYNHIFTTAEGKIDVRGSKVLKADGNEAEALSDFAVGSEFKVNTEYANTKDVEACLSTIVAYYCGNRLAYLDHSEVKTVESGEKSSFEPPFIVPDMTGIDGVKVFVWDNAKGMLPFVDAQKFSSVASTLSLISVSQLPEVSYNYPLNEVKVSGSTTADRVVLQILKKDTLISDLSGQPSDKDLILYTNQLNKSDITDGKYTFNIQYAELEDESFQNGVYNAYIMTDSGDAAVPFTLDLYSKSQYETLIGTLNEYAKANNVTEFKTTLKNNSVLFGYISSIYSETAAEKCMEYVKTNNFSLTDSTKNTMTVNRFLLMQKVVDGNVTNVDAYMKDVLSSTAELYTNYNAYTDDEDGNPDNTQQIYLTGKLKAELPVSYTYEAFETALKKAIMLTGVRYTVGPGEAQSALAAYGSIVGIASPVSMNACRSMAGKDYDDAKAMKEVYAHFVSGSSGGSGGGSGSGGSFGGSGAIYEIGAPEEKITDASTVSVYFEDIDGVEWAVEAILALADKGIINGTGDGNFKPNLSITREEFVKILVGAMGMADVSYGGNTFSDVSESDWFCPYVNIAYENNIVSGIGNGKFGTGELISRQDMVVMICNAIKAKDGVLPAGELNFRDASQISDYAIEAVAALYKLGAVNGVSETHFDPLGNATRAQAAKIIYGVLDMLR